jgi:cytochrome c biogenesis protein
VLAFLGLLTSLFVPRRRLWIAAESTGDGVSLQYAGLARGDDPGLERAVSELADSHVAAIREPSGGR